MSLKSRYFFASGKVRVLYAACRLSASATNFTLPVLCMHLVLRTHDHLRRSRMYKCLRVRSLIQYVSGLIVMPAVATFQKGPSVHVFGFVAEEVTTLKTYFKHMKKLLLPHLCSVWIKYTTPWGSATTAAAIGIGYGTFYDIRPMVAWGKSFESVRKVRLDRTSMNFSSYNDQITLAWVLNLWSTMEKANRR